MADVTITPTQLAAGTESADLVGSGTAVNAAQTFAVDLDTAVTPIGATAGRLVLIVEELNAGAATITIDAGDYPPSALKDKGSDTITLAQADLKAYVVEMGRHLQNDATITGTVNTNNCKIRALLVPIGHG